MLNLHRGSIIFMRSQFCKRREQNTVIQLGWDSNLRPSRDKPEPYFIEPVRPKRRKYCLYCVYYTFSKRIPVRWRSPADCVFFSVSVFVFLHVFFPLPLPCFLLSPRDVTFFCVTLMDIPRPDEARTDTYNTI